VIEARFEELYDLYCDGTLRAEEREEFLRLLEDPENRERLVSLCVFEASISEETHLEHEGGGLLRGWELDPLAPDACRIVPRTSTRRARSGRSWKRDAQRSVSGGLLAAAALLLLMVAGFFLVGESDPPVVHRTSSPKTKVPRSVPEVSEGTPGREPQEPRRAAPAPETPPAVVPVPAPREPSSVEPPPVTSDPLPLPLPLPPAPAVSLPAVKPTEVEPPKEASPVRLVARLERCAPGVWVVSEGARSAAEAGRGLLSGQGVVVGPESSAVVRLPDGTRLELGADTQITLPAESATGKMVRLEQGFLSVEAAKQAPGHPLTFTTTHSESMVLGTEFTLLSTPAYTRLDVREGRVKFTRLPGITSLVVTSGHFAIAGPGFDFVPRAAYSLFRPSMAGLQLWLKADVGVKMAGKAVTVWKDQSPSGNDASQAEPVSQPAFVPQAVLGRPAIRFDGVDDFFSLPSGFGDFRAGLTAFLVVRVGATPVSMRFLDFDQGPTCDNICLARKDSPDKLAFWVYANCLSKGKVEASGGILIDQFQSLSAVYATPGRVTLYRNGAPLATGMTTVPRDVLRKPNYIGKSNTSGEPFFKGDLCEVLLYNRALSDEERGSVEWYLNSKYFDVTTPPVTYRTAEK